MLGSLLSVLLSSLSPVQSLLVVVAVVVVAVAATATAAAAEDWLYVLGFRITLDWATRNYCSVDSVDGKGN